MRAQVSRKEFRKAMPALGLEVPAKDIDTLFDSWDKDGGGSLNFKELQKILRAPAKNTPSPKGMGSAAAAVKAANKLKGGKGNEEG